MSPSRLRSFLACGVARVQAETWSIYGVQKEGYETVEWDPEDHVLRNFGPLYLSRSSDQE